MLKSIQEKRMKAKFRQYQPYKDSPKVSQFLARTYPPTDRNPNWLRARWEYMVYSGHDGLEENLTPIGIWECGNEIVGMMNFESRKGEAYFQVHPEYTYLKEEMLRYAETALYKTDEGKKRLTLYVNEFDHKLEALASAAGYLKVADSPQVTSRFDMAASILAYELPDGFKVTDRSENNDLRKINRVLWRGFNHEGPPPEKYVAGRASVEKAPLFKKDLVIMVAAPDGNFVSYCGVWYEESTKVAYVEPVATDPDYRRQGLGKKAVLEAISRAKKSGATRAIVGSGLEFCRAIGFRPLFAYIPGIRNSSLLVTTQATVAN
jgi:GNAT superfamily N-acetyltransferase